MQLPVERIIERRTRSKAPPACQLYWPRVTKVSKHERRANEKWLHPSRPQACLSGWIQTCRHHWTTRHSSKRRNLAALLQEKIRRK